MKQTPWVLRASTQQGNILKRIVHSALWGAQSAAEGPRKRAYLKKKNARKQAGREQFSRFCPHMAVEHDGKLVWI